jgi:hypothetical protein
LRRRREGRSGRSVTDTINCVIEPVAPQGRSHDQRVAPRMQGQDWGSMIEAGGLTARCRETLENLHEALWRPPIMPITTKGAPGGLLPSLR